MPRPQYERTQQFTLVSGASNEVDTSIIANDHLIIDSILVSSDGKDILFELLYSEDDGLTWINPFQPSGNFIRRLYLGTNSYVYLTKLNILFVGGVNRKIRWKVINNGVSTSKVSFTVKGQRLK